MGSFTNAGQACIRPNTLYVSNKIKDKFIKTLLSEVNRGWGSTKEEIMSKDFGLQISKQQTERVVSYLKDHGGKVLLGGDFDIENRYISPTLIHEPRRDSLIGKNEVFGPICIIYGFDEIDEVISEINEQELNNFKPLAMYYFGNYSGENRHRIEKHTSSGSFLVNDACSQYGVNPYLGFGGVTLVYTSFIPILRTCVLVRSECQVFISRHHAEGLRLTF